MSTLMLPNLNHNTMNYLTVYLSPSSPYFSDPSSLSTIHPAVSHVGPVGVMKDVQLISVPKQDWHEGILEAMNARVGQGIERVEFVQEPRTRVKRGDEL